MYKILRDSGAKFKAVLDAFQLGQRTPPRRLSINHNNHNSTASIFVVTFLRSPTIRTNLFCLLNDPIKFPFTQPSGGNLHVDTDPHIKSLHIPNKINGRLDEEILFLGRYGEAQTRGRRIHRRLEAREKEYRTT